MDSNSLARALRYAKSQFSLDPQPDQDFLSAETAADTALGAIPGIGQAMALRDMERARRAEDPVAGGLAAAGLLPFGRLGGAAQKLIGGAKARNAPDLAAAKRDLQSGMSPESAWSKYGAYEGPEYRKPMKFEIPDQGAGLRSPILGGNFEGRLGDMLTHPEAFKQYPELADYKIAAKWGPNELGSGEFRPSTKSINATGRSSAELLTTILHELQHAVQGIEGFSSGANPKLIAQRLRALGGKKHLTEQEADAYYWYTMGEAEARAVEERLRNTREFNKAVHPKYSYDVEWKDMIHSQDLP